MNSPYARFNAGILNQPGSFRSLAMGGISTAMRDNNNISFSNPASYSAFDTASFVFDMGMDMSILSLEDGNNRFSSTDMNFRHILMGFPVSKRVGIATGLVPYSNGYYYIAEEISKGDPGWSEITGDYTTINKGSGSITSLFAGTGVEIMKNVSAGINLSFLFGKLERHNQLDFSDYSNTFSQKSVDNFNLTGLNFDYGIQYEGTLKKNYFISAGLSFTASNCYRSTHELLKERYTTYYYPPYSPDTLANYSSTTTDSTKFPYTFRIGLMVGKKDKFTAGIDFVMTGWNQAKIQGGDALMADTRSLMAGLEYIPEKYSNTSFLRRIEYRAGARISDNYLVLNGIQLKEYSFTAGFAIRLKNSFSKATFYFDYTRRNGDVSKGLHNENIWSVGVSLNFYDFWFLKREYE
ncbi:MAG: hypothetical protein ACUVTX_04715 [Bacteroidales bacterium]